MALHPNHERAAVTFPPRLLKKAAALAADQTKVYIDLWSSNSLT